MKIPIARTSLTNEEFNSVLEPLKSGWMVQGPKVKEFEEKWSNFTRAKHSVAVTSCTSGMLISLVALGFKAGDEAIVPSFTWASTANVIENLGGKVNFCDINLDTFNIDASKIEKKITSKTKVILPVHLFGLSADINAIIHIARKYNLWVLEDAACGFGCTFEDNHVGTFGDVGCFSLHPRKAITTGEGGMITTNNTELAEKIVQYINHGASKSDLERHLGPKPYILADHFVAGFNQRMTDIQGALGSSQMNRAKDIVDERIKIANIYRQELKEINSLKLPSAANNGVHGFQSFACLFQPKEITVNNIEEIHKKRNKFMESLLEVGVSTRPATHAVHMLSYYKKKYNLLSEDFLCSYIANHCSVSLPLYNGMRESEQNYVIEKIKKLLS